MPPAMSEHCGRRCRRALSPSAKPASPALATCPSTMCHAQANPGVPLPRQLFRGHKCHLCGEAFLHHLLKQPAQPLPPGLTAPLGHSRTPSPRAEQVLTATLRGWTNRRGHMTPQRCVRGVKCWHHQGPVGKWTVLKSGNWGESNKGGGRETGTSGPLGQPVEPGQTALGEATGREPPGGGVPAGRGSPGGREVGQ